MTHLTRFTAAALISGAAVLLPMLLPTLAGGSNHPAHPTLPSPAAGAEVVNPRLISRVMPEYPEEAREAQLEANTILQVMIRKDGTVEADDKSCLNCVVNRKGRDPEEVLRGWCDDFCRASAVAVRQWRYEPGTQDGEPVDVYFTVVLEYELP